jgi:hypothetical protein
MTKFEQYEQEKKKLVGISEKEYQNKIKKLCERLDI